MAPAWAPRVGEGTTSLTTAKATAGIATDTRPHASWWVIAGSLFACALAVVLTWAIARSSDGHLTDAPAPIVADGADLVVTQGTGRKDGTAFVVQQPGPEGISVLTARLS